MKGCKNWGTSSSIVTRSIVNWQTLKSKLRKHLFVCLCNHFLIRFMPDVKQMLMFIDRFSFCKRNTQASPFRSVFSRWSFAYDCYCLLLFDFVARAVAVLLVFLVRCCVDVFEDYSVAIPLREKCLILFVILNILYYIIHHLFIGSSLSKNLFG